jgi:hypothetical protein
MFIFVYNKLKTMKIIAKKVPNLQGYWATETGHLYKNDWWGDKKKCHVRVSHNGYLRVWIIKRDGKHEVAIHTLIAQAFIPNPENKPWVNHKDFNKENNHVSNLEWVTHRENMKHYSLGCKPHGVGVNITPMGTYQCRITFNNVIYNVCTKSTSEEAAYHYSKAEEAFVLNGEEGLKEYIKSIKTTSSKHKGVSKDKLTTWRFRSYDFSITVPSEQDAIDLANEYYALPKMDKEQTKEWFIAKKLSRKTN